MPCLVSTFGYVAQNKCFGNEAGPLLRASQTQRVTLAVATFSLLSPLHTCQARASGLQGENERKKAAVPLAYTSTHTDGKKKVVEERSYCAHTLGSLKHR